jgi:hypothetical protein
MMKPPAVVAENASATVFTKLSGLQWAFVIVASGILLMVLVGNCIVRNARRWRELSDFKLHVISDDFLTLKDLPRVSSTHRLDRCTSITHTHTLTHAL